MMSELVLPSATMVISVSTFPLRSSKQRQEKIFSIGGRALDHRMRATMSFRNCDKELPQP